MNDPVSNTGDNISKRTFSCASRHVKLHIFLYSQRGIDSVKDEISKWKFTEIKSLWDRQYCTEGVFRVYRISIAILLLTQQCNFNQYRNEVLDNLFLPFFVNVEPRATPFHSIENYFNSCSIGFLFIIGFRIETEDQLKCEYDKLVSNNSWRRYYNIHTIQLDAKSINFLFSILFVIVEEVCLDSFLLLFV